MDKVSEQLFARAKEVLPGGVNSPVRAFRAVGGSPVFVERAEGPFVFGADGTRYVDMIGSWGPMILGHAHPRVTEAVCQAMQRSPSFGAPTRVEVEFAERLSRLVPSLEMMRMTSSGTEAVMGALRVARGFTGRDLVLKFEGCYHGGADYLLVQAGSGLATLGVPTSKGVPSAIAGTTVVAPFNDLDAVGKLFAELGDKIAAVILEPVVGNMGCVPPEPGFLEGLREITQAHGSLLVFDEVMTGFRLALGGAQERFAVKPDLSCFGKVIGGGLPVGAYGGRKDVMSCVAPLGGVYQAGTLSGNPLAMSAGVAVLDELQRKGFYDELEAHSAAIELALQTAIKKHSVHATVQRVGSMLTVFFGTGRVRGWDDAKAADTDAFKTFFHALLQLGVLWPPSQFEAAFVSISHQQEPLEIATRAFDVSMAAVASAKG